MGWRDRLAVIEAKTERAGGVKAGAGAVAPSEQSGPPSGIPPEGGRRVTVVLAGLDA